VTGAVGGAQAGYRLQTGDVVAGVEADMSLADLERSSGRETVSVGILGSGRVLAGYALDKLLLYGTGGFGFGQIEVDHGGGESWNGGWIVGVGAEVALGLSWTARLEAFHYDIGDHASEVESNGIRAGLNYRF
jgi:outer membrane immunogenic protein